MQSPRQDALAELLTQAAKDPALLRAMAVFKMGREEYAKAIAAMTTVTIISGDSTTPLGEQNAVLDRNEKRD